MSEISAHHYRVNFRCEGAPPFVVLSVAGREALGAPFEITLEVSLADELWLAPDEIAALFEQPATMSFGLEDDYPTYGVVREVRSLGRAGLNRPIYAVLFVPRLWDARFTRGSFVYLDKSFPDLVRAALDADIVTDGDDYELSLASDWYPEREFILQYDEDDLSFVRRKAEHYGVTFFFVHENDRARAVFVDDNSSYEQLDGFESVAVNPRSDAGAGELPETIFALRSRFRRAPAALRLSDFSDRIPSVDMTVEQDVDPKGYGTHHRSNEHYAVPQEGAQFAQVRAAALLGPTVRFEAESRLRGMRPGHRFTLVDDGVALETDVIVTAVEHGIDQGGQYVNTLTLHPYDIPFRPPLTQRIPRVDGVIPGKVDSESGDSDTDTPLDEHGRYKIQLPFVVNGEEGGKASCWIRMASNSAGPGHGVHVPLHKGTEVAVYFVGGNPDRPIIAGAVPNTETASPVNDHNPNQSVIRTRGGITLRMSD